MRLNAEPPVAVLDSYAPFCKLHAHHNGTSTRTPLSGLLSAYLQRIDIRPGISCSAISISLRPQSVIFQSCVGLSMRSWRYFIVCPAEGQ